ncbi:glycosyltransferase, partial [Longimicrobium sp.]|uniref:glycosyltransferase n=1 Tax=Longimicrobium sp. TaxID=2029185 RepID=UPI002F955F43
MKVAVCAVTYLRPRGLARLLEGLAALRFGGGRGPELEIVVVDNDPARSAEAVCDEWSDRLPWPLRYRHEERRGVSHARNAAVAAAREAGAEMMAFIDDDEVPQPGWLDELLRVQAQHDADVVAGPVLPV